jgi:hypothetical protein
MAWQNVAQLNSRNYKCGWCGNGIASSSGYNGGNSGDRIFICPHCKEPTLFIGVKQIPGVTQGEEIKHLPADIEALYRETRNCAAASCYTASVLICRKLLMNIAVNHGAKEGGSFVSYVEHLANSGFVPPNGRGWVDHIRKKGNEATHEIALMSNLDAEELISFAEMLLKFIYEFPNRVPAPST